MKLQENLKKPIKILLLLIVALALWLISHFLNYRYNLFYFDTNDILGDNLYIVSGILFYSILIVLVLIIYRIAKNHFKNLK